MRGTPRSPVAHTGVARPVRALCVPLRPLASPCVPGQMPAWHDRSKLQPPERSLERMVQKRHPRQAKNDTIVPSRTQKHTAWNERFRISAPDGPKTTRSFQADRKGTQLGTNESLDEHDAGPRLTPPARDSPHRPATHPTGPPTTHTHQTFQPVPHHTQLGTNGPESAPQTGQKRHDRSKLIARGHSLERTVHWTSMTPVRDSPHRPATHPTGPRLTPPGRPPPARTKRSKLEPPERSLERMVQKRHPKQAKNDTIVPS